MPVAPGLTGLSASAAIGAAAGVLKELNVEDATIRQIVAVLAKGEDALRDGELAELNGNYLGGSAAASVLDHHVSIAHRHVVEAMQQMVIGLAGYQRNVRHFHQDVTFIDESSNGAGRRISAKVDGLSVAGAAACANAPDVRSNPSCAVPTGGTD